MAWILPAIAGANLAVSAGQKLFGGRGDRRAISTGMRNLENLRPRIRSAGAEATGAAEEAVGRFRDFDSMAGFDEELAARTRAPLEAVRTRANRSGTFRSGRAIEEEQRVIGQESAQLLTARQRLTLQSAGGMSGAARTLSDVSLDALGAESELESGLIDYRQGKENQRGAGMLDAFRLFLQTQGGQ